MSSSSEKQLSEILQNISEGLIQLPEFQRDWVWDDNHIKQIIISLCNNFPVGAVMFLETGGPTKFKSRFFSGINTQEEKEPQYLVLDGQQRLTSILNALYLRKEVTTKNLQNKTIKRFYYLNINELCSNSIDWDNVVISVDEDKQIKKDFGKYIELDLSSQEKEIKQKFFPTNIIFDEMSFSEWRQNYQNYYLNNEKNKIIDNLNLFSLLESLRKNIYAYRIPVISLTKDTPKEAVCQVFENVNTGGVALNVFELLTAIYAADDFNLREDWEIRKNKITKKIKNISSSDFLMAVTLYTNYLSHEKNKGLAVSCKRKDILNLKQKDYENNAEKIEKAFIQIDRFLKSICIFKDRDIPYQSQLIPLATVYALLSDKTHNEMVLEKIKRWYWCGVLGEMYGGAVESRFSLDVLGLMTWIENSGDEPDTVKRAFFDPDRMESLQTRNSAAYKGIMALILKEGAKDFISADPMTLDYYVDGSVDIHHIFPKDYCLSNKIGLENNRWNSVVNKTPVSAKTNRMIGGKAPSIYLKKLEEELDKTKLKANLSSHMISIEDIYNDNFDNYYNLRKKALIGLIAKAIGKEINYKFQDKTQESDNKN